MHKYTKILLVVCIIGVVAAILFRPSGKLLTGVKDTDYLALYEEARSKEMPIFLEFYGDY